MIKTYPSKISNSLSIRLSRHFVLGLLVYFVLWLVNVQINNLSTIILLVIGYAILTYIITAITNTDVILEEKRITFNRTLPGFRKVTTFELSKISKITFQHDWTDTVMDGVKPRILGFIMKEYFLSMIFPPDYKWIKIQVGNQSHKFYCFGLEHDYYDNEGPIFEDLFIELGNRGFHVEWTNMEDHYYKGLMNRIKNKNAST